MTKPLKQQRIALWWKAKRLVARKFYLEFLIDEYRVVIEAITDEIDRLDAERDALATVQLCRTGKLPEQWEI